MNTTPFRWLVALVCLLLAAPAMAQSPDLINEDRDLVRVMRHPDGSRSVYKRQAGWRGMRCATYTASGKLAAINDYTEGKYGRHYGYTCYEGKNKV